MQRCAKIFYDIPVHGKYKIETFSTYDPDQFRIKCFKHLFWFFWTCVREDVLHEKIEALQQLSFLLDRYEKLGGVKYKEIVRE